MTDNAKRAPRMEEVTRRFRVTGKVQGVYFRHSTRLEAERLTIRGHARNLPDGSVEVLAVGAHGTVESLRQWLHHGPTTARVEGVEELEPPHEALADDPVGAGDPVGAEEGSSTPARFLIR